ncbi:MAG: 2OG-Fe(II) oxygenase [Alphaproteobacteria bacterium]|nr:2OG-Fe(II) oxygenase [Alphaproteobacteria bacterium]
MVARHFISSLTAKPGAEKPYKHWLLNDVLPCFSARQVTQLPYTPATITDTYGKRDTHNTSRHFFNDEAQKSFSICADIAGAFQSADVVRIIEKTCTVDLQGSFLRIEYCQDKEGFWLEPHTDIGVKLFTMVVYLTQGDLSENMGTDIYDASLRHVGRAPSPFNSAIVFIPAENTWHGFEKRQMPNLRRSIIVNYVKPEWRSRYELAFQNSPISTKVD